MEDSIVWVAFVYGLYAQKGQRKAQSFHKVAVGSATEDELSGVIQAVVWNTEQELESQGFQPVHIAVGIRKRDELIEELMLESDFDKNLEPFKAFLEQSA